MPVGRGRDYTAGEANPERGSLALRATTIRMQRGSFTEKRSWADFVTAFTHGKDALERRNLRARDPDAVHDMLPGWFAARPSTPQFTNRFVFAFVMPRRCEVLCVDGGISCTKAVIEETVSLCLVA